MGRFEKRREAMVREQIAARGVTDPQVLAAMRNVPRHLFVPSSDRMAAYRDGALRIEKGQTISQPYIVALMTALLKLSEDAKVLDVGTGSGYQAAVLAEIAAEVHTIERHLELAEVAAERLSSLGYHNITVHQGDGSLGYLPEAPYDGILVAAAAHDVPQPLLEQLNCDGGRLVMPVGSRLSQRLCVWERQGDDLQKRDGISVVFVPLIGQLGWQG
jgi:protein-L-isoaspartate(D-aspartate) O-methyltransferase